jgi:SAM-dependent methyltransferase
MWNHHIADGAFRGMRPLLRQPGAYRIFKAIVLNQANGLRLFRRQCGGHRILAFGVDSAFRHISSSYERIAPRIGSVQGKIGLEIGPGDNLGLADFFLAGGAKSMYAVEQFASVEWSEELRQRIYSSCAAEPGTKPELLECKFEQSPVRDLDFIYSVDVMEHVQDLRRIFRQAYISLKPGGMFVNAIDFSGHNAFRLPAAPLNFLMSEDWLYHLMHSHIVTSNRCRPGQVVDALQQEGFIVQSVIPTRQADEDYVRQSRPYMLPRFRSIPESELAILEAVIVAQRPLEPDEAAV